jgi:hypothetical protein
MQTQTGITQPVRGWRTQLEQHTRRNGEVVERYVNYLELACGHQVETLFACPTLFGHPAYCPWCTDGSA